MGNEPSHQQQLLQTLKNDYYIHEQPYLLNKSTCQQFLLHKVTTYSREQTQQVLNTLCQYKINTSRCISKLSRHIQTQRKSYCTDEENFYFLFYDHGKLTLHQQYNARRLYNTPFTVQQIIGILQIMILGLTQYKKNFKRQIHEISLDSVSIQSSTGRVYFRDPWLILQSQNNSFSSNIHLSYPSPQKLQCYRNNIEVIPDELNSGLYTIGMNGLQLYHQQFMDEIYSVKKKRIQQTKLQILIDKVTDTKLKNGLRILLQNNPQARNQIFSAWKINNTHTIHIQYLQHQSKNQLLGLNLHLKDKYDNYPKQPIEKYTQIKPITQKSLYNLNQPINTRPTYNNPILLNNTPINRINSIPNSQISYNNNNNNQNTYTINNIRKLQNQIRRPTDSFTKPLLSIKRPDKTTHSFIQPQPKNFIKKLQKSYEQSNPYIYEQSNPYFYRQSNPNVYEQSNPYVHEQQKNNNLISSRPTSKSFNAYFNTPNLKKSFNIPNGNLSKNYNHMRKSAHFNNDIIKTEIIQDNSVVNKNRPNENNNKIKDGDQSHDRQMMTQSLLHRPRPKSQTNKIIKNQRIHCFNVMTQGIRHSNQITIQPPKGLQYDSFKKINYRNTSDISPQNSTLIGLGTQRSYIQQFKQGPLSKKNNFNILTPEIFSPTVYNTKSKPYFNLIYENLEELNKMGHLFPNQSLRQLINQRPVQDKQNQNYQLQQFLQENNSQVQNKSSTIISPIILWKNGSQQQIKNNFEQKNKQQLKINSPNSQPISATCIIEQLDNTQQFEIVQQDVNQNINFRQYGFNANNHQLNTNQNNINKQNKIYQSEDQTNRQIDRNNYNTTIVEVNQQTPQGSEQSLQEEEEYVIEEYQTGSKYEGFKANGMRSGRGKFFYQDGGHYEGQWKKNKMHGFGKLYYEGGRLAYEGNWRYDEFHGFGKVYNDNPIVLNQPFDYTNFDLLDDYWEYYEGSLVSDTKEGRGKIKLTNRQVFQGDFSSDRIQGFGKYNKIDGSFIEGIWRQSKLIKILNSSN